MDAFSGRGTPPFPCPRSAGATNHFLSHLLMPCAAYGCTKSLVGCSGQASYRGVITFLPREVCQQPFRPTSALSFSGAVQQFWAPPQPLGVAAFTAGWSVPWLRICSCVITPGLEPAFSFCQVPVPIALERRLLCAKRSAGGGAELGGAADQPVGGAATGIMGFRSTAGSLPEAGLDVKLRAVQWRLPALCGGPDRRRYPDINTTLKGKMIGNDLNSPAKQFVDPPQARHHVYKRL